MTADAEHPALRGSGRGAARAGRHAVILSVLIVVVAAAAVIGLRLERGHDVSVRRASLDRERANGVRLSVKKVTVRPEDRTVTLPGDVYGFSQTTLYAKVSGYVQSVRVERGQHVERGEVLAQIESPENEKDVVTAQHDWAIARINAIRAEQLAPSGVVSQQDRDNAAAQAKVARSSLGRAQAVLSYTTVRAPFDGVVTARYVDPGALVPAATGATQSALPIVDIADIDDLRVFVYVGQDAAPFVHAGDRATVWQDELPTRRITASVTHSTGALDVRTRTMQVEVDLDNRAWGILPGTFAHVELRFRGPPSPLIPDEAIVIRDGKTNVCVVHEGRAHYEEVKLGYNDGREVTVLGGLLGGETIGIDVPVEIGDGDVVQPTPAP
ncbi:MAG: efflux RND transporter periplasmic adaptor subunit [Polyangiaceae bacterium]|jgi:RND family efflux transporter MFP subunit